MKLFLKHYSYICSKTIPHISITIKYYKEMIRILLIVKKEKIKEFPLLKMNIAYSLLLNTVTFDAQIITIHFYLITTPTFSWRDKLLFLHTLIRDFPQTREKKITQESENKSTIPLYAPNGQFPSVTSLLRPHNQALHREMSPLLMAIILVIITFQIVLITHLLMYFSQK